MAGDGNLRCRKPTADELQTSGAAMHPRLQFQRAAGPDRAPATPCERAVASG